MEMAGRRGRVYLERIVHLQVREREDRGHEDNQILRANFYFSRQFTCFKN